MTRATINSPSVIAAKSFFRGLPIAALQACGVLAVAEKNLAFVFVSVFAINWWWVNNVRSAHQATNRLAFAVGASCGGVIVVWLSR